MNLINKRKSHKHRTKNNPQRIFLCFYYCCCTFLYFFLLFQFKHAMIFTTISYHMAYWHPNVSLRTFLAMVLLWVMLVHLLMSQHMKPRKLHMLNQFACVGFYQHYLSIFLWCYFYGCSSRYIKKNDRAEKCKKSHSYHSIIKQSHINMKRGGHANRSGDGQPQSRRKTTKIEMKNRWKKKMSVSNKAKTSVFNP